MGVLLGDKPHSSSKRSMGWVTATRVSYPNGFRKRFGCPDMESGGLLPDSVGSARNDRKEPPETHGTGIDRQTCGATRLVPVAP